MLSYALRSFVRQFRRYAHMVLILACAMVTPLMLTILGSSMSYGERLEREAMSHGADFRIEGAWPELAGLFQARTEFSTEFSEGNIFLTVTDSAANDERGGIRSASALQYADTIDSILSQANAGGLKVYDLTQLNAQGAQDGFSAQLRAMVVLVLLVSVLIFAAGYRSHVESFREDVYTLYEIGASRRQIALFFLIVLAAAYALSFLAAVVFSVGCMSVLFRFLLQVVSGGYAWMVFHVEGGQIVLLGALWMALLLAAYTYGMLALRRVYARTDKSGCKTGNAPPPLRRSGHAGGDVFLLHMLWTRTGGMVRYCIFLLSLSIIMAGFLVNYASINAQSIQTAGEGADFTVARHIYEEGRLTGFTQEEREVFARIPEAEVTYRRMGESTAYLVQVSGQPDPVPSAVMGPHGEGYLETHIAPVAHRGKTQVGEGSVPVWVNPHQPAMQWRVGDTVYLYRYAANPPGDGGTPYPPLPEKYLTLEVAGFMDAPYLDGPLQLFVEEDAYRLLMDAAPVNVAVIRLRAAEHLESVRRTLNDRFGASLGYSIDDMNERRTVAERGAKGLHALIAVIALSLMSFVALVVSVLLRDYVERQRDINDMMFCMGLAPGALVGAYNRMGRKALARSITVGVAAALTLTYLFFHGTGYRLRLSIEVALLYALMLIASYISVIGSIDKAVRGQRPAEREGSA